jgi:hypothetical protein
MPGKALVHFLRYAIHGETTHPRAARRPARRGPARCPKYRAWIRSLPSAISGLPGCQACHTGNDGGMSQKASDFSCIPLTYEEHMELDHGRDGRAAFELRYSLDIAATIRQLNAEWFAHSREVK